MRPVWTEIQLRNFVLQIGTLYSGWELCFRMGTFRMYIPDSNKGLFFILIEVHKKMRTLLIPQRMVVSDLNVYKNKEILHSGLELFLIPDGNMV